MSSIEATSSSIVASSSVFESANFDPNAMTPESLMTYLQSRLGSIDVQMNDVLSRQKKGEQVRGELHEIQIMLTNLDPSEDPKQTQHIGDVEAFRTELETHIANIADVDPNLASKLSEKLFGEGQIMAKNDDTYVKSELEGTKDFLNIVSKDLDSGAQMDMIALQQMMSTRQTAIQLATGLVASLGDSAKAIASNIR
ncbi:MAG: hypothetical protein QM756_36950 [Polyangiaceae bacterium]